MNLSLERLLFDPANLADGPKVGSYLISAAGDVIAATDVAGVKGLNVNMINEIDIRDLVYTQDSITSHQGGSWTVAATQSGTWNVVATATDLDIRDLVYTADSITAHQGGAWSVSVSAMPADLDIRDLVYTQDSITSHQGGTWNVGINPANTALLASAVAVTSAAAVPVPATSLANRKLLQIQNVGAEDVFVGSAAVSSATGLKIAKGATESLEIGPLVIYAITASGKTSSLRVLEIA